MKEIFYWLALSRISGIGPVTACRLLEFFENNIKLLFNAPLQELQQVGLNPKQLHDLKNPRWGEIEKDVTWCEKNHCHLVSWDHLDYPALLRETPGAPLILYIRGDVGLLKQPQLAMVGSRNPTPAGARLAEEFAKQLASAGLVITSGLALGVDAASHRGALEAKGKTIAVLGTGLQHIYPAAHRQLAAEVIANGALVSEFSPQTPPRAKNFPLRNRVISGLSLGVVVVEAALRSGSLITARYAVEQNREVFAIPGSIHNPLARGCHQLIRQGAKLIETAADILEELGTLNAARQIHEARTSLTESLDVDPQLQPVLAEIGYEVTALDVIIMRTGLTAGKVSSMLLSLELEGYVHAVIGGYVRATGKTI